MHIRPGWSLWALALQRMMQVWACPHRQVMTSLETQRGDAANDAATVRAHKARRVRQGGSIQLYKAILNSR
ncbi:hypothetical protein V8E36_005550 [Tilletia maclaganii]